MSNFKKKLLIIDPHFFSVYNMKIMQLKPVILCSTTTGFDVCGLIHFIYK
jgi:hypothetical protein